MSAPIAVRKGAFFLLIASLAGALACSGQSTAPGADAGTDAAAMGDAADDASTSSGTDTGAPADANGGDADASTSPGDSGEGEADASMGASDSGGGDADASMGPSDSGGSDATLSDAGASDGGTDGGGCSLTNCDAAVEDAGAHHVVLSGGFNGAGLLTDTWLWDGAGWTQQNISGPTPARPFTAAAPLDGQIVLYGGFGPPMPTMAVNFLADTWLYDGSAWTQLNVSGPGDLYGAAAAGLVSQVVVFGGNVPGGPPAADATFFTANTWTWDGARWTLQNVPGPSPRANATAASWNGKVVLFGGNGGSAQGPAAILSDTWIWDGAAWTQQMVTGPTGRIAACAATLNGELVLFGGGPTSGPPSAETWVWDGTTWTQKNVSGPSARQQCGAATLDGKVVLFGGIDATSTYLGDTWLWDGVSWTQANVTGPPARENLVMITL